MVNLVTGINGVGKTSLFEAIELVLCGKSARNQDTLEAPKSIEVVINDTITELYSPSQTEIFKARDLLWYSNANTTRNNLHHSFNRYNFFNADAAYNFANGKNDEEIREALLNLVMGPEYNLIRTRAEKFLDQIRPDLKRLQKDFDTATQAIRDLEKIIENSPGQKAIETAQGLVGKAMEDLALLTSIESIHKDYIILEGTANQIKAIIDKIKQSSVVIRSKKDLQLLIASARRRLQEYQEFYASYDNWAVLINRERTEQEKISRQLLLIKDANKYFADERFFALDKIASRFVSIQDQIKRTEQVNRKLTEVDFESIAQEQHLDRYLTEQESSLQTIREDLKTVTSRSSELILQLGTLERIVQEIKSLGHSYIDTYKNSTECPLCNAHYEPDDLGKRIKSSIQFQSQINAKELTELNERQYVLERQVEEASKTIENLNKLKAVFIMACGTQDSGDKKISQVILEVMEIINKEKLLREELALLNETSEFAISNSVSAGELAYLKTKINQEFPDMNFEFINKKEFEKRVEKLEGRNTELKIANEEKVSFQIKSIIDLKNNLKFENSTLDPEKIKVYLEQERTKINELESYFLNLEKTVKLTDDMSIDMISVKSDFLITSIKGYSEALKNLYESEITKKKIIDHKEFTEKNKDRYQRLVKAKSTLEELLGPGEADPLSEFFDDNMGEVLDIFKTIHSPKEFTDVAFENGELILVDINEKKRTVTQISTGQRSALALSIFISLNRKLKNGPNIIMFDDPVSFIDDFNALLFLDYLRFFVLKDQRQIFFATANKKLANLFEKKFQFLEEDFKQWKFERMD